MKALSPGSGEQRHATHGDLALHSLTTLRRPYDTPLVSTPRIRAFCRNTTDEWRRRNVAWRDHDESATPFQKGHSA